MALSTLLLALLFSFSLPSTSTPSQTDARKVEDIRKQFVGNWQLVTYVSFDANGEATNLNYAGGRIMYDEHGNMAAQLMRVPRAATPPNATPEQRPPAAQGYTAYYGKFEIDPATESVTHNVLGALNFSVGSPLVRYYKFLENGNRLTLSIKNAQGRVTGTLTWERLK